MPGHEEDATGGRTGHEEDATGGRTADLRIKLDAIAQAVGEEFDAWWVELWTFAPDRDTIECRAFWCREQAAGAREEDRVGAVIGIGQSHDLRRLILTGSPAVRHADDADTPAVERDAMTAGRYRSRIDYPLILHDRVLGVLSVADAHGHLAAPDGVERLGGLCRLAASALDALVVVERQRERMRHLVGLLEPARSVAAILEVREAVERVKADIAEGLPGMGVDVEVYLRREDGCLAPALEEAGADGAGGGARQPDALARQSVDCRLPGQARSGDTMRLVVPLAVGERVTGCLDVAARMPRRFRDEEVELVGLLAGQVAVALRNARVCRALENRSATDPLTGLYSSWYFYERLPAEVARARRYGEPLALMLVELDDAGRLGGDDAGPSAKDVVSTAARLLRGCLRDKVDVACSRGGGRFAVLLPNTPALGGHAGIVAERVRRTLEETAVTSDDARRVEHLTASIAVAGFPTHAEDADDLGDLAEAALAAALRSGGNRIVVAGER
jgi:diguanylate cyclase (GGDEF)-like protein